mgnify:CR=1 FL=1
MDHLIAGLCAYALTPRIKKEDVDRILLSVEPERDLERVLEGAAVSVWQTARRSAKAIAELDIQVVAPWDLPRHLRRLAKPPRALFVRGPAAVLYGEGEAIVGSRKASPGPMEWAKTRAREAVEVGRSVISGGARGIDAEAHRATWGAGGAGIVVLGVAVDRIYPSENRHLFSLLIKQGGAVVSEHPPLAETYASHHATRNRLIAGLCERLWIAEAGKGSGTLHTARAALGLNTSICVPPARIGGERDGIEWLLEQDGNVAVV